MVKDRFGIAYYVPNPCKFSFYFRTLGEVRLFKRFLELCQIDHYYMYFDDGHEVKDFCRKKYIPRYQKFPDHIEFDNLLAKLMNYVITIEFSDNDNSRDEISRFYSDFKNWCSINSYRPYRYSSELTIATGIIKFKEPKCFVEFYEY